MGRIASLASSLGSDREYFSLAYLFKNMVVFVFRIIISPISFAVCG